MGREKVNEGGACRTSPGSGAGRHFRLTNRAAGAVSRGKQELLGGSYLAPGLRAGEGLYRGPGI